MILSIQIENYKSIEKMSASFGEINALIGKNGAGKTTLISAINIVKNLAKGLNVNDVINEVAPLGEFFNCNSNNKEAKFTIKIQTPTRELFLYTFSISFGAGKVKNGYIYYVSNEKLYKLDNPEDNNGKLIFRRTAEDDTAIEVNSWSGPLTVTEKIPLQVDPSVLALSSYSHKDVRNVASTLSSYSVIWIEDSELYNRRSSIVSSNNLNLDTIDGVAVDLYTNNRDGYNEAIKAIARIIPGFKPPRITKIEKDDKNLDKRGGFYNFLVSWFDSSYANDSSISRVSLSGGNSRVIYLILSLYNSRSNTCFVAEEIENGMHLSRISRLIDQLRMIVKNRKIQLFFTTHNHLILEDLLPKEVIYVKLSDCGSTYTKLSETKEYQDIAEALGRVPSSTEVINSGLLF